MNSTSEKRIFTLIENMRMVLSRRNRRSKNERIKENNITALLMQESKTNPMRKVSRMPVKEGALIEEK
jgi:hypothetical protein